MKKDDQSINMNYYNVIKSIIEELHLEQSNSIMNLKLKMLPIAT